MHIILHQPEIPANTGNIGRTCAATGTDLHLIEPLGFRLNEKEIKRAGMDYWERLNVRRYMNFEEFILASKRVLSPHQTYPFPGASKLSRPLLHMCQEP